MMDRMGPTSGRGGNDPINIHVCITKVIKPLMIIIPLIVMVTIVLIKVKSSSQNQCKPCYHQVKPPESYYEFGRSEEKNNNKTNQEDTAVTVITDNEEVTNEAGREQFVNDLRYMNNR